MSSPAASLAELVAPNLHVALIHYPLGLLVVGVLIELLAFLWPRSTVRAAGRWMILVGALSAIPAAFSGIYALRQIARVDLVVERTWAETKAASVVLSDSTVWNQLVTHTIYQSVSTGLAVLAVLVYLGSGDLLRHRMRFGVLAVLVLSVAGMGTGAWFSGEAIYKHGAGVDRGWPDTPANSEKDAPKIMTAAETAFPPTELHVIAAGATIAVSLAAVGLSFRKRAVLVDDLGTLPVEPDGHGSADLARSFNPHLEVARPPLVPAGRWWVLALLVAVATAIGGLWVEVRNSGALTTVDHQWAKVPAELWHIIRPDFEHGEKVNRTFAHLVAGGTIVLLPVVLALLSRWGPRGRVVLSTLTGLLVLVAAAQVWLGVLLLYDGPQGPVNHFNAPPSVPTPPAMTPTSNPTTAPVA